MTEKNEIIDRGRRLQSLRKKVGLTRLAFAEQTGMSANTLKALELGDRELTSQKALLFSNLFSSLFSVSLGEDAHEASFEYLFYGTKQKDSDQSVNDSDDGRIQSEINFFTASPSYLMLKVSDGLMSPFYNEGDIVAGRKLLNKSQFPLYQGHVCIIETSEGHTILRRIIKSDNGKITACILNTSSHQNSLIVEEIEARSIAQAIWHLRISELV